MAEPGATFLLNSPYTADEVWDKIPSVETQQQIIDKKLKFYVIDGLQGRRTSRHGRPHQHRDADLLLQALGYPARGRGDREDQDAIEKTYGKRGRTVVERNFAAVDGGVSRAVKRSSRSGSVDQHHQARQLRRRRRAGVRAKRHVGDDRRPRRRPAGQRLRPSTAPSPPAPPNTRSAASPANPHLGSGGLHRQCGLLAGLPARGDPHEGLRPKKTSRARRKASSTWPMARQGSFRRLMTIQVAPDDCTGCGVCVDVCPAKTSRSPSEARSTWNTSSTTWSASEELGLLPDLPECRPHQGAHGRDEGQPAARAAFEFSGACAGCGETPYVKLISQLFGDRMLIANATGCSSIYGGNLPTTPFTTTRRAWPDLEQLAVRGQRRVRPGHAPGHRRSATGCRPKACSSWLPSSATSSSTASPPSRKTKPTSQSAAGAGGALKAKLEGIDSPRRAACWPGRLLVERSVWIVGGDGWAYDIGFGGLDHVLWLPAATSTAGAGHRGLLQHRRPGLQGDPRGRVAKFAASGKPIGKKDLGMIAMAYGNVYVAQIAMGANQRQTDQGHPRGRGLSGAVADHRLQHCIAHGIDMTYSQSHMKDAVKSGFWPLYRFTPHHETEAHRSTSTAANRPCRSRSTR
jgi:pyruvate-ferredoxin/flavodoxin oxidoreductase